ncbi:unannotated protein [freshwater metagenome]|uniref:Unannotated protein n=1 Tax=freshwater metagenome TaxID=449393 RepID=A0A6J6L755_9ZZZZ
MNNLKIYERKKVLFISTILSALFLASCGVSSATTTTTTSTTTTTTTTTTVAPLSCAKGGVCEVGDIGPGGGTVMYVASEPFTSEYSHCSSECQDFLDLPSTKEISACRDACNYLEVSNVDVGTQLDWVEATKRVSEWNANGLSDWFLPTVEHFYLLSRGVKDCKFFKSATGQYMPDYWMASWDGDYNQPKFFSLGGCGTGRTWYKNTSNVRPIRAG